MHSSASAHTPLVSDFADDPSMTEIISEFVAELPDRISAIRAAVSQGDSSQVRRLAHHLNGAGGGYGFPIISEAAAVVEQCLMPVGGPEPRVARAAEAIEILAGHCRCASSSITDDPAVRSEPFPSHRIPPG
ncbi:MAG: HPt (histidine-containing phosphotransfer) domain-containing protein [Phycisphaerales bacterium]|jgi:HPt (histidine-containing phosphotransfer) domain-containing protein